MTRCTFLLGFVWLLTAAPFAGAETIVIDDFNLPDPGYVFFMQGRNAIPINTTLVKQEAAGILGDQRDVLVEVLGTADVLSAAGIVGFDPSLGEGMMQLATFGTPGTRVTLQYDGIDTLDSVQGGLTAADGLGGYRFGGAAGTGLLFHFLTLDGVDVRGLDVDITMNSSLGGSLHYSGFIPDHSQAADHLIPFADFTATGPASFEAIDSLTIVMNGDGTPNVDFELDSLEALIPEPSTWAMLGLGLLVVGAIGRRWQNA